MGISNMLVVVVVVLAAVVVVVLLLLLCLSHTSCQCQSLNRCCRHC
jgi:hypothetical protein